MCHQLTYGELFAGREYGWGLGRSELRFYGLGRGWFINEFHCFLRGFVADKTVYELGFVQSTFQGGSRLDFSRFLVFLDKLSIVCTSFRCYILRENNAFFSTLLFLFLFFIFIIDRINLLIPSSVLLLMLIPFTQLRLDIVLHYLVPQRIRHFVHLSHLRLFLQQIELPFPLIFTQPQQRKRVQNHLFLHLMV